jgi:predicted nucleic acid-binding protein
MIKIFFDASVLFAALYSQTGASYALACFVKERTIRGITTQTVVEEVLRNSETLNREQGAVYVFITRHNFIVRECITKKELQPLIHIIASKDAHVLAGALQTHCDYLVTLDKKHINNDKVKKAIHALRIVSPQEMLEIVTAYTKEKSQ